MIIAYSTGAACQFRRKERQESSFDFVFFARLASSR